MTKQEIYNSLQGRLSITSIKEYSDEYVIFGKFGMVAPFDDGWDVWITGIHQGKELTQRKVNNLVSAISSKVGINLQNVNGESWGYVKDSEGAFLSAVLLGARRKRKVSPSSLINLRKARCKAKNK